MIRKRTKNALIRDKGKGKGKGALFNGKRGQREGCFLMPRVINTTFAVRGSRVCGTREMEGFSWSIMQSVPSATTLKKAQR